MPRACSSEIEGLTQSPLTSKIHISEWGHWGSVSKQCDHIESTGSISFLSKQKNPQSTKGSFQCT